MSKLFIILCCFLVLSLAGCAESAGITNQDKATVIRLTLERALVQQEIPDYQLIADKENIILSTENFNPEWLPSLTNIHITLLTPEEIQAKANSNGDFLYLRFHPLEIGGEESLIISLDNIWAVSENSDTVYLSGGGFTIEYQKKNGEWHGELTKIWIS